MILASLMKYGISREPILNRNHLPIIVTVAAFVMCGGGWLLLPTLQGARRSVDIEASVELERARRLLHMYNASLAYEALLVEQLNEEDMEVDFEDISEDVADQYQQSHTAMWEAYQPSDWAPGTAEPRPARANYGSLSGQIRQGLSNRAQLATDNEQLLDDALAVLGQALSIARGEESSRTHAEANRLKGVILHHKGLAKSLQAQLHRRNSDRLRQELVALAIDVRQADAAKTRVADSRIDERIDQLQVRAAELETLVAGDRQDLAERETQIEQLEARLAVVRSRRDDARAAISGLQAKGMDFSDARGAESFRIQLEAFDQAFREADRQTHALTYGAYKNAQIDESGDYLTGRYVEIGSSAEPAVESGLVHLQRERAVLAGRIEGQQRAVDNLRSSVTRLEGTRQALATVQEEAGTRIAEAALAGSEMFAELNRIDSEAFSIEDAALDLLDQSVRVSKQAVGYADSWIRDARDRTQGLSPEATERSAFGGRLRDRWLSGDIAAQQADAHLARAWIFHDRFRAYSQSSEILAEVGEELDLKEADVQSERAKTQEAHDAGVEEIKQAMDATKRAFEAADHHWTIVAQSAGTTYLLALFGHEDYVDDTIEAYRNALKGREDKQYAQVFVTRLSRLEQR